MCRHASTQHRSSISTHLQQIHATIFSQITLHIRNHNAAAKATDTHTIHNQANHHPDVLHHTLPQSTDAQRLQKALQQRTKTPFLANIMLFSTLSNHFLKQTLTSL